MKEKVSKEPIQIEPGYLYYFGKDGCVWAAPMKEKQREGAVKKRVGNEQIKQEEGWMYYIGKDGYVWRTSKPPFKSKLGINEPELQWVVEALKKMGVSPEAFSEELVRIFELSRDARDATWYQSSGLLSVFADLARAGLIKTPADAKNYGDMLLQFVRSLGNINFGEDSVDSILNDTLKPIIKMGLVKSPQDLQNYSDGILLISKSFKKDDAEECGLACFYEILPHLLKNGLIKSLEDFKNYGSELIRVSESPKPHDVSTHLESLVESNAIKSPEDIRKAISDFLQSPSKE